MNILFICTSNKDRSPALESYFREVYPQNSYRSAGVNSYFCKKKETHLVSAADISWSDLIVFAEQVHLRVTKEMFEAFVVDKTDYEYYLSFDKFGHKSAVVLECGAYEQGCIGEDYLTKAETKLKEFWKYSQYIKSEEEK